MALKKHNLFVKAISTLCAFSIQFSAFAGWWDDAWTSVCNATTEAVRETKEWISAHEEEIVATVAIVAAVAVACNGGSAGEISTHTHRSDRYTYTNSHASEGPYKPFTQAQKNDILRQNRAKNGGVLRSDYSGKILEEPHRYTKGYTPSPNEAQIDHIHPRSNGGWNSANNAQVLSREENLKKSDNLRW